MQQSNLIRSIILAMTALTVSACGGGGSGSSNTSAPGSTTGKVVDGYVSGAKVTLDINDDRICGATEPSVISDASGNYSFAGQGQHMVCASGGTDLSTNQPLIGTLLAPPGATQATPLTTLVMAQLNISKGTPIAGTVTPVSLPDARAQADLIANKLGLGTADILNTDPVAAGGGLATTTSAVQALMVKSAQTIQAAGGGGISTTAITSALYADAAAATASALTLQPTPLATSTLGNIAKSVVTSTLASARIDSAVTGLSRLASLDPAGLPIFAAPTIQAMTNAIASATPGSINTPGASNPAQSVATNVALTNTVADVADTLLTTTNVAIAGTTALGNIANQALSTDSKGVTTAASGSIIVAAIYSNIFSPDLSASAGALLSIQLGGANGQPVVVPTYGVARGVTALAGAKAVIDINDDHVCESTEPTTTTNSQGVYIFDTALGTSHMVCVSGGTDPVSYELYTGTQLAPAGSTEANVLTTLVVAHQLNHPGTSASAAAAAIAAGLGLPAGTDLLTVDPYTQSTNLPAWPTDTLQTQVLLTEVTDVIMAAAGDYPTPGDAHTEEAYLDVARAAANSIASNTNPSAGQNLAGIAHDALAAAKTDTLLSTTAMTSLNPDKITSFITKKLLQDNATLAPTPFQVTNTFGLAIGILRSPVLTNLVAALNPLLLTTNPPVPASLQQISSLADDAFGGLPSDSPATAQKVLADLQGIGITLSAAQQQAVTFGLEGSPANMAFVQSITFIANGQTVSPNLNFYPSPNATADLYGALSEIILSMAPDETAVSAYQPGSLTLSVTPVTYALPANDKRALRLTLEKLTFQQDAPNGVLSATFPTTSVQVLSLTGTNADGGTVSTTLSGSQAANVLNFAGGKLALNLANLQADLQAAGAPGFDALSALTSGNSHNQTFNIDLDLQGLRLAKVISAPSAITTSFNSVVQIF